MFRGSPGNKPPLLPIGAERAHPSAYSEDSGPELVVAGDGNPNSSAPEWGQPFQTYFKARKLSLVPPVGAERDEAKPSRPNWGDEKQKQRSSSSGDELKLQPEQQAGPIYQAPQKATAEAARKQDAPQPNRQQHRASDAFGMPPVREEDEEEVPLNFDSPEPQSPEAPLEYTNAILYNDLVTVQQRSCKLAQYIRDALPTHMQRQLFQQEIIGQHVVAERKFCELLEKANQTQAQAQAKAQIQDQKQDQKDHPKQNKHHDQNQDNGQNPYRPTVLNNLQYRAKSLGPDNDTFGRFKKGSRFSAQSTPMHRLMRGSPPGSLLTGSVPDSSSGGQVQHRRLRVNRYPNLFF
ncbi:GL13066 [Drosophila persimilis]|uniref:GL13066 n=1 Tax=Drosophila persimilis TaxID=7234 RepID=B4GUZ8_DROPE|nr:GL13066 [Drosophila persimilis]